MGLLFGISIFILFLGVLRLLGSLTWLILFLLFLLFCWWAYWPVGMIITLFFVLLIIYCVRHHKKL